MTIESASAAYASAQAELSKQKAALAVAQSAADDANAPFGNSSTVVREGYRIPEEAMVIIRKLKADQAAANTALDKQTLAVSMATAAKDQAKLDLTNAVRDSDITDAVEQTA